MKYFVRGLTAVLLLVVIQVLACAQSAQVWSSYKSFQLPVAESAFKMVHGPDGSFYTLGTIGYGTIEISRYDSSGNPLWVRHFATGPFAGPTDIAVSNAWVVVTARVTRSPEDNNGVGTALLRYDTSGNPSPPVYSQGIEFTSVALAANGDALAAYWGSSLGTFSEAGYVRYSPAGTLLTTKVYSSSGGAQGLGILDNAQGITLVGALGQNRFVAQYTDAGTLKWDHVITIVGTTNTPVQVAADPSGLTYLDLGYDDENTGNNGSRVLKYDLSGTLVYDTDLPEENAPGFAVGPSGQVGLVIGTGDVIQLMPNGVVQWHTALQPPSGAGQAATYDASGNLYYVGYDFTATGKHGFMALMDSSGVRQWLVEDTTPLGITRFASVSLASGGVVGFGETGPSTAIGTGVLGLALYKVDTTGAKVWSAENAPADSAEVVKQHGNRCKWQHLCGRHPRRQPISSRAGIASQVRFEWNGPMESALWI